MAETINGIRTFKPANREAWRKWLVKNHTSTEPVGLIVFHKKSKTPNISYEEAVEEALCFGWIDNKGMKRDDQSMYLQFCRRKEKSNWSNLNRERAERMIREGFWGGMDTSLTDRLLTPAPITPESCHAVSVKLYIHQCGFFFF